MFCSEKNHIKRKILKTLIACVLYFFHFCFVLCVLCAKAVVI